MRSHALDRGRRRLRSSLAIAASVVTHLIILAALIFGVRRDFAAEPTPVADVELIPAWPSIVHPEPNAAKPGPSRESHGALPPAPSTPAPELSAKRDAEPSPTPTPAESRPLPPVLRLGLGCVHADFMRLTAEERAACRDRFASRSPADRDYADAAIDPKARTAFDAGVAREKVLQTPFLAAMPKKGCRPRVTEHDAAAFGKSQPDFTMQATCVVHF